MLSNKKAIIFIFTLIELKVVLAYIDPGTAGLILSGIGPIILLILAAIAAFFSKYLFKPVKKGVLGLWKKIKRKD